MSYFHFKSSLLCLDHSAMKALLKKYTNAQGHFATLCFHDRYDSSTGKFTVPPGGSGLYYIYVHGIVSSGKSAGFRIRHNEAVLCRSYGEVEYVVATCGAAVVLQEGMSSFIAVCFFAM